MVKKVRPSGCGSVAVSSDRFASANYVLTAGQTVRPQGQDHNSPHTPPHPRARHAIGGPSATGVCSFRAVLFFSPLRTSGVKHSGFSLFSCGGGGGLAIPAIRAFLPASRFLCLLSGRPLPPASAHESIPIGVLKGGGGGR